MRVMVADTCPVCAGKKIDENRKACPTCSGNGELIKKMPIKEFLQELKTHGGGSITS